MAVLVPVKARLTETSQYEYPEHLRPEIAALPRAPGVYTFHGDGYAVPLYIGKSVDIRTRVMGHMRTPEEARLLRQTRRIDHVRTAGDLGAQLLESQQIKLQQPLHNKKLRRTRRLCSIRLMRGRPEIVSSHEMRFASTDALFGLFSSRTAALQALRAIADDNRLCYGLLSIEKNPAGRPCFRASINRCNGACCGRESLADHQERLEAVLQELRVAVWPYAGAVGLVERGPDMKQIHVVRDWHFLGSASTKAAARRLDRVVDGFDNDCYRILVKPVLSQAHDIVIL